MKRLHKKIGVGVLVAGLLLGAGGISGGSVVNAASSGVKIDQSLLNKVKKEEDKKLLQKIFDLGVQKKFDIVEVGEQDLYKLFGKSFSQLGNFEISFNDYSSFESNIGMILGFASSQSFIKVKVGDLRIILAVF